ncbi:MAG: phage holin family protein [Candidatus Nanopelagicales bacterium]
MRFLLRLMVWFVSALIGIVVADILLPGFEIDGGFLWAGYLLVALIFAIVQSILAPLTEGLTRRHARAFSGGVGIISTLIALGLTAAVSRLQARRSRDVDPRVAHRVALRRDRGVPAADPRRPPHRRRGAVARSPQRAPSRAGSETSTTMFGPGPDCWMAP